MKTLRLTFGKSENITRPDFAAIYRFPFTVIDTDLIGSAEETRHSLDVKVTATQRAGLPWKKLSEPDTRKILFEIGRQKIMDKAERDNLSAMEEVIVNASEYRASLFNPSDIMEPDDTIFYVEKERRRIGF